MANKLRMALAIVAIASLTIIGVIKHEEVKLVLDKLLDVFEDLGLWSAPLIALVTACATIAMLPTFPLLLGAAAIFIKMFGKWPGIAVAVGTSFSGLWLGSIVAFLLGRAVFKEFAEEELHKYAWMQVVNHMIDDNGWWVVFLVRMSPLLPAEAFNYVASLSTLSLPSYMIGCCGTLVPFSMLTISSVEVVEAAEEVNGKSANAAIANVLLVLLNVLFLAILSVILYWIYKRYEAKHQNLNNDTPPRSYLIVENHDARNH